MKILNKKNFNNINYTRLPLICSLDTRVYVQIQLTFFAL